MTDFGYGGSILIVDAGSGNYESRPSAPYTSKFIGGHGLASRLYWELVPPDVKAFDPENALIAATGPVCGFSGFAGGRWKICARTPMRTPESFAAANLGDRWGAVLKYAGYDALVVRGKADRPVYLYIHDGKVEIKDAAHLRGKTGFDAIDMLKEELGKDVGVLAVGPAGENLVRFSTVIAEEGAIGSGGIGAVMGSKNVKAIVVAGDKKPVAAHPERVSELRKAMGIYRPKQDGHSMWGLAEFTTPDACSGCGLGCSREIYTLVKGGRHYRTLCQSSVFYQAWVMRHSYTRKDEGLRYEATRACDGYGLDSTVVQSVMEVLEECCKEGILTEEQIGLPVSQFGKPGVIDEVARKIAFREGYGDLMAEGTAALAQAIGPRAVAMLPSFISTAANDKKDYDPRMLITTAMFYATEPRRPIQQLHEIAFPTMMWNGMPGEEPGKNFPAEKFRLFAERAWGDPIAADFSTYEGKALAAKKVQDHAFVKESMVTCDLGWMSARFTHILDPENTVSEAQIYSAITGKEVTEAELDKLGERVYNLQRAIFLRQGWQGRKDDMPLDYFFTNPIQQGEVFFNPTARVPGRDGQPLSKVGWLLERDRFEEMKTDYYGYRGWDPATGYPTRARLEELDLGDVADDLETRNLLG